MELSYWEKQLILYTKNHYGRIDYDIDLKHFPAKYYGFEIEQTDTYNVVNMVVGLYEKLVENRYISFNLKTFIWDNFKRAGLENNKPEISFKTLLRQLLAEIQSVKVKGLNLGNKDEELFNMINN